ncbi:MAG: endonuclease domain-containing protein, partial [Firmicutes bacterium]|nr:endonuclease domain-containing protein [Bacillota bacterium]
MVQETVRYLRRHETESERLFWELVRNRRLTGLKFSRQVPFTFRHEGRKRFVVVDFYCAEKRLAVEIDGGIHDRKFGMDAYRTMVLGMLGIRVLRIRNEELKDRGKVKEMVFRAWGITHPPPTPLSKLREG